MMGPFDDATSDRQPPHSEGSFLDLLRKDRQLTARLAAAALGSLLLFSPWLLGVAGDVATWSAWALGFAVLAIGLATAADRALWPDRLLLAVAIMVMAMPWTFGFADDAMAAMSHVVIGLAVILVIAAYLSRIDLVGPTLQRLGRRWPAFRQLSS